MPRVAADGVSLAVHEWPGTGPAIVCIHGLTANHVCWQSMADILAPAHRLIGYDLRAEIIDALGPAINRLGIEFPSLDAFLTVIRGLPMLTGRWNDYLGRYFRYDVETLPSGAVRSKASKSAIAEELANLQRERLWVYHHQVKCPTLVFRAPDGLLTQTDCLMTQAEAVAMARAIPKSKLVVVPKTNHYTVLLGKNPKVASALRAFLRGR